MTRINRRVHIYNRHEGQTIVIAGCGTSLTKDVCRVIKDSGVIAIGVNRSYQMLPLDYSLHADYKHTDIDRQFSSVFRSELKELCANGTILFAPVNHNHKDTTDLYHFPFYADIKVKFAHDYDDNSLLRLGHSSSSVYHALQVAVIMGASRIVLVGVDFYVDRNKGGWGKMHCYDHQNKQITRKEVDSLNKRLEVFEKGLENKALPILKKRNVAVLNASPKSNLKCFEKVDLKKVI